MSEKKAITGKLQGKVHKRVKSFFKNDEAAALKDVLAKNINERSNNLVPNHTDKTFVWRGKTKIN